MIELQAKLLRGPVYFSRETIQCLITLRNVLPHSNNEPESNSSDSSTSKSDQSSTSSQLMERLCWANVQLICFCLADEQQVNCEQISDLVGGNSRLTGLNKGKRSSIAVETYSSGDTSFHESLLRTEKGIIVYSSNPKILFCDLQLGPHECQTFVYTETLPPHLNPSYSSSRLKYQYKLIIGAQRIGSSISLFRMPIRILSVDDLKISNGDYSDGSIENGFDGGIIENLSINSSFTDDDLRDDSTPLDLALHKIENQTCNRNPHCFNVTNSLGRVAKFLIFKTIYRLGEDIIGVFNFSEGTIPCLRFTVELLSEETVAEAYRVGSKASNPIVLPHSKCQEYTFNTTHAQMLLTIPLTATPSFANDIVSLEWKLRFQFVISQNSEQASSLIYSRNEDGIQSVAPHHLNVQCMTWDFPIKVMATHPAHVAKGFQLASIGTMNI